MDARDWVALLVSFVAGYYLISHYGRTGTAA